MKRTSALLLLLLLAGCVSPPRARCVRLAAAGWFCPLPPAALAPTHRLDLIRLSHKGHTQQFIGQLVITHDSLRLALTNFAGIPLADIRWDGRKLQAFPAKTPFRPGLLVALIELTRAPAAVLRRALYGLKLSAYPLGSKTIRVLRSAAGGTPVARATIRGEWIRVVIPGIGLVLEIAPFTPENP